MATPLGICAGLGVPLGSCAGLGVPLGSCAGLGVPLGSCAGLGVPLGSCEGVGPRVLGAGASTLSDAFRLRFFLPSSERSRNNSLSFTYV